MNALNTLVAERLVEFSSKRAVAQPAHAVQRRALAREPSERLWDDVLPVEVIRRLLLQAVDAAAKPYCLQCQAFQGVGT